MMYQIVYKGPANSKYNLAGNSFSPNEPKYFLAHELKMSMGEIKKHPQLEVTEVELSKKPDESEIKAKAAELQGKKGIVWLGATQKFGTDYGMFQKGVPRYDIALEHVLVLAKMPGFQVLG